VFAGSPRYDPGSLTSDASQREWPDLVPILKVNDQHVDITPMPERKH
jgi:hypothetical protein